MDSGGFTELNKFGVWKTTVNEYATFVKRCQAEIGNLQWVAPMDWMCEPFVLQRTGNSLRDHQIRTLENFLQLRDLIGDVVIPVLQGWELPDYLRHVVDYEAAGICLIRQRIVGIGSVCRRQATQDGVDIVHRVCKLGIPIHAFGFKVSGLRKLRGIVRSADSMAWSFAARSRKIRLDGCLHLNCNSCLKWALVWRNRELGEA